MSNHKQFTRTAIVLALSAIFPVTAAMADDDVEALTNPNVTDVSANLPYINKINPLYRQYNGINHEGLNGNANIDIVNRDADGNWFKLYGENLGLSTQEAGISYEKQGDWAVGLDYNQIPRYAPFEVYTGIQGVGSNTITQPNLPSSAFANGVLKSPNLYETTLKTERDITTLTASKYLLEGLKTSFSFKNENKTGSRMDGVRGVAGTGTPNLYSGFLFAPEPIDQNHQQFEATLDYVTSKYQVTAGYYGSFLSTNSNSLNVIGGTNTQPVTTGATGLSPIALSPDNQSQQFYVNGAYNFSDDTRGTMKLSRSQGIQNDNFLFRSDVLPGVGSNLEAKVVTTEAFASLTSRVTKDLKVLGSWRYEDKNDKTPVRLFYTGYPNNPESHTANWGKLEGDYRLGGGYSATVGVDYNQKKSEQWERHEVEETTGRFAVRKAMSETVNGMLMYAHASRTGSEWEGANIAIYPVYLANRSRDRVRGLVDWSVIESLNLQFAYEAYFDTYTKSAYGLESGDGQVFSLDASYVVNDDWKLNAWYSTQNGQTKQNMQGAVCSTGNNSNCTVNTFRTGTLVQWDATLKQNSDQFGFGAKGKIAQFEVGMSYLFSQDKNKQDISSMPATTMTSATVSAPVAAGNGVVPDTSYTQNAFKFNVLYPVSNATKLRLDYIYDLRKMDDYTWSSWVYADGTKVYVDPNQVTQIIGLSLIQSF